MEIVSFVRVIYVRVLPTLDSHICDRDRKLFAIQCNHLYVCTRFVTTNIKFTTLIYNCV